MIILAASATPEHASVIVYIISGIFGLVLLGCAGLFALFLATAIARAFGWRR